MNRARQGGTPFYFVAQECHVGYNRLINEDAIASFSTANGKLFIVVDGLIGQSGGGVASRVAMESFYKHLLLERGEPADLLRNAVLKADEAVLKAGKTHPELQDLGVSLAALLLKNNEAWYINVGESRIYLTSSSGLKRLSRHESQSLAKKRSVSEAQINTNTLGAGTVDVAKLSPGRHFYRADDGFLLSSSGLKTLMDEKDIQEILAQNIPPENKTRELIEKAVLADGNENISLQFIAFKPGNQNETSASPFWLKGRKSLSFGFICGLILGATLMYLLL